MWMILYVTDYVNLAQLTKTFSFFSANKCNKPTVHNAYYTSWFGDHTDSDFFMSCYPGYKASHRSGLMKCGEDGEMIDKLECIRKNMDMKY